MQDLAGISGETQGRPGPGGARPEAQEARPPMGYTTALEDMRRLLAALDLPANNFSEHSGRHWGATCAAEAGCSLDDIQLHGRWRSSQTPLRYKQRSLQKEAAVSSELICSRFVFCLFVYPIPSLMHRGSRSPPGVRSRRAKKGGERGNRKKGKRRGERKPEERKKEGKRKS